uniref:Probable deoxycytidylate deaminase n=1 Tax=Plectus sambesii TaxID=2011161 RepID=A0A914UNR0_9BILA
MNSAIRGLGETPTKAERNPNSNGDSNDDKGGPTTKRTDFITWNDYFMAVACLASQRSKDPNTQVGAVIVNEENKIVGTGYNGMPNGCSDDELPWGKDVDNYLESKYAYVVHAEMNAILNKNASSVKGCRLYTVLFPCNECAKLIIQAGINHVIYIHDKPNKPEMQAARIMFDKTNVKYTSAMKYSFICSIILATF